MWQAFFPKEISLSASIKLPSLKTGVICMSGGILILVIEVAYLAVAGKFIYYGHLVGHIFMAVGTAMILFSRNKNEPYSERKKTFSVYGTNWIYYTAQPLFVIFFELICKEFVNMNIDSELLFEMLSIIALAFSCGIVFGIYEFHHNKARIWRMIKRNVLKIFKK